MAVQLDLMQTYDQSTALDYSIADGVHNISPVETFLQRILPKVQVTATKDEWIEDELIPDQATLAATISDSTVTSITVSTTQGTNRFRDCANVNRLIKIDEEYMLVTAESSDVLTVTRGYNSTTPDTHAANSRIWIIAQLGLEGADAPSAIATVRTRPYNYVQTLFRSVEVSGLEEAVRKLGGITSEIEYQVRQRMMELANELEQNLLRGTRRAGSSTVNQTMGGLATMITTNSTSDSGAITKSDVEEDIRLIYEAGGIPRVIIASPGQAQQISNLYADRIRSDIMMQVGGQNITAIMDPLGAGLIGVVPHRKLYKEYYTLDTARLALGYVRPFFLKDLADDGDADKRAIYGDYTLEIKNEDAHARRYGNSETA